MATAESVKEKIQGLIDKSNNVTGADESDLTSAVDLLAKGYGNAPIPYDEANEGDKLYKAYFASGNLVHVDDSTEALANNGTLYNKSGVAIDEAYLAENHMNLSLNAVVSESSALKVDGADTNGKANHRYVGRFPMYDLENKTYTYEFEYFRNYEKRHKFYFAAGTFINRQTGETMQECGCDVKMPNLAIQLTNNGGKIRYVLVRQSWILDKNTENIYNNNTQKLVLDANGDFTAKLKIVLKGHSKKRTTLYANYGEVYNGGVNYWVGDVIPIDFEIYHTVESGDMLISSGSIYQPADVPLVCGVGDYDVLPSGKYYGVRDLSIYKGDRIALIYKGDYVVTPKKNEQTLQTAEKYLTKDITIKEIPYAETSNSAGGTTVTIG